MKISVLNQTGVKSINYGAIDVRELLDGADSENMSVAIIELHGVNKRNKNTESDMFYFILKGEGVFNIDGKEYSIKQNYLVSIPKNTVYFDSGKMTMLSFCNPRFDSKNVEYLD